MAETQRDRVSKAIGAWMASLETYPGWREWKHKHIGYTLHFDGDFGRSVKKSESEFKFSNEIEKQHTVVIQYLGIHDTIESLKECEFYFRRYPFHGLPINRHRHITNMCEMYFWPILRN